MESLRKPVPVWMIVSEFPSRSLTRSIREPRTESPKTRLPVSTAVITAIATATSL